LASFSGPGVYGNPALLTTASPPGPVSVGLVRSGNSVIVTLPPSFVGQFQVTVTVSDGFTSVSKSFVMTVT
jgi:hypothetical protein